MSDDRKLILVTGAGDVQLAESDLDQARAYVEASVAAGTKRAYSSAWKVFTAWCEARAYPSLPAPPGVVAAFIAEQAGGKAVATIEKYVAAIGEAHRLTKLPVPTGEVEVKVVLKGIRRTHGTAQRGKAPLLVAHLRRIAAVLPDNLLGARDRAILLVGFAAALRRSELVGLDVAHLDFRDEGLAITIARSKTDQEGTGRVVGVPYGSHPATCPVRATRRWLEAGGITDGPLCRPVDRHGRLVDSRLSAKAVGLVVKRAVAAIGLDPGQFGGHSLRAGLATEAARAGAGEITIMRQTGHRSVTTLRGYVREGTLFTNNAAALVGL